MGQRSDATLVPNSHLEMQWRQFTREKAAVAEQAYQRRNHHDNDNAYKIRPKYSDADAQAAKLPLSCANEGNHHNAQCPPHKK